MRGVLRMSTPPAPSEIFDRAADEGERRLDQTLVELLATGFIAGFTIVFGIVALAITHAFAEPQFGEFARVLAAIAFAPGIVFLVVGRAELFTENFFDPLATVFERRKAALLGRVARLWVLTFVLNVAGGALLAWIVSYHGVLPHGTPEALRTIANEIAARGDVAGFLSGIIGGALVALLSFLLLAVNSAGSRIAVALMVGFLLALGPFDHVIVTSLHLLLGMLAGAPIEMATLLKVMAIATVANIVGGVGLVTLSHVAQAKGARE